MAERILQDIAEQKIRLTIAQITENRAEQLGVCYTLATDYSSLGDFHQAIEYHKQYLSIAKEDSCRACEGKAYFNLGHAYGSLREFQRAIEYHKKSLCIAKEIGDRELEKRACCYLGILYQSLREFQRAIKYHNQHLSIAREVGHRRCEGDAYYSLGFIYQSLSEFQRAIECHKEFLYIAEEIGDRKAEGCAYRHLGTAYQSLSEFQRALEYHKESLCIAEEVGDRKSESRAYDSLGTVYHYLCEFQRAIEHYEESLRIARNVGDKEGEGCTYGNLGNVYQSLSEFQQAMDCHKKSLSIAKEINDRETELLAYCRIGTVYGSLGNYERAKGYHKQSLSTAKEFGDRKGEEVACCNLSGDYHSLNDFKKAIKYSMQHLSIADEIGDRMGKGCAHNHLGSYLLELGSLNEALDHFRCSVKIYDTVRASYISEDGSKISFRTHHESSYTNLWQVLVMLERNDEALYAAERGRAQALFDALKVTYGLTSLSPGSIESEEEVRYISRKTTVLTVFLALHLKTVNIWVLGKEGNPVFRQKEIEIGREHEDSFTFLLDTVLKNIRAGVGIRCENRSMDKLSDDSTPSSTLDDNRTSEPSQGTTDLLQPLYDAVLGPIEDLLDGHELIVVPDGALSKAPWAALSETLRIRTVPSLTSLKVITDSPREYHSKSGALLVGDPCLKKITNKWGNPIYDPLKYARMEVEMIEKILKSQSLTGEDATKEAVLQNIGSVALVHIAAHGRKETGEIVLAPDPRWESKTPTEKDYILKMSDIQAVKLRARLVVLSCCHSGQGPVSSEGVVGMARAFLFAGARSVLATLWAIDDEATMMFMKSFYEHLGSGESAAVALQRAMKCLRDSQDYSAPKYWAPFVLMGDDVRIELEKGH
ncbi:unnamed protein product [Porites evermanni]|uniref:CHAT domain-containing protein n=1 Tax=Porites evermanni TaxID=104178 RepID=A0ABN8QX25_9CNID|nr:unnamed protein product [Porites evermanni]